MHADEGMCHCVQVLYAVALIPAGYLADKADRPRLLAGGLALWSVLTMAASKVSSLPPCHMGFGCCMSHLLPSSLQCGQLWYFKKSF